MTADIFEILVTPDRLVALPSRLQAQVVHQARHAALLGYLDARITTEILPAKLADHLAAARTHVQFHDTQIRRELLCLADALSPLTGPVVLLKGAAYKAVDPALSEGRLASDIDLLLPRTQLAEAEALLGSQGWIPLKTDAYEDHYYREWMHELPPLRHPDRGTVIDLHHNILPPTARFKPDADKLLGAAEPLPDSPFYTLSPTDTLLHRCAHLFADGDLHNCLRELVDIDNLLAFHGNSPEFSANLIERARALELAVPLYYGLYFSHSLLRRALPDEWLTELASDLRLHHTLTRKLMEIAFLAVDPGHASWQQRLAGWSLYVRSHWLRMPPLLLARHLMRQIWRRGGVKAGT